MEQVRSDAPLLPWECLFAGLLSADYHVRGWNHVPGRAEDEIFSINIHYFCPTYFSKLLNFIYSKHHNFISTRDLNKINKQTLYLSNTTQSQSNRISSVLTISCPTAIILFEKKFSNFSFEGFKSGN